MELRITLFDTLRKSYILTTPPFPSIEHIITFANTFIWGLSPSIKIFVTNEKNVDVGYFENDGKQYVLHDFEKGDKNGNNI